MIKLNLQFFGGRGASSSGGGSGKYSSVADFENAIGNNPNNPQSENFFNSYMSEADYSTSLERNIRNSISEDGYNSTTESIIDSEEKMTRKELKELPKQKTPAQLGKEEALKERLDILKRLRQLKGTIGNGRGIISII